MNYNSEELTDLLSRFINTTNQHIFLTGKAGTGKTTFLRNLALNTHKKMVIAAPTGIAAINAGGVTLHSLFQLPFGSFLPDNNGLDVLEHSTVAFNTPSTLFKGFHMHKKKRQILQQMELLVIDEVSMLRADLLDTIDLVLRSVRRENRYPFGGVQVLFIGDLLQLPPVVKDEEWLYLSKYYNSPYFFASQVLQQTPMLYVELEKIYRQTDARFINLLNNLRENTITAADIDVLNGFYQPDYQQKTDDGVIMLTTHNRIADDKNASTLAMLSGHEKRFKSEVTGEFNEYNYPAEAELVLKVGAQVMFIKNDYSGEQLYFNGKIGFVESFNDSGITVAFNDGSASAVVELYTWENKKYVLNKGSNEIEESVAGTFKQYPLKLAWAITVHKSQGLTFDKAIIDVNRAFAPGQIYVALSRLRDISGLILTSKIPDQGIPISETLKDFSKRKKTTNELPPILRAASDAYLQNFCLDAYDFSRLLFELRSHAESYNKTENRSEKQQHKNWAYKLFDDTQDLKKVADTFRNQIHKIIYEKTDGYLAVLHERIEKSIGYFEPLIKGQYQKVLDHMENIQQTKGVKAYRSELEDLASAFTNQLQLIYKAQSLLKVTQEGNSLEKGDVKKPKFNRVTSAPIIRERKKKETKAKKIPTHEISYELFKQGKTIAQIAQERTLIKTTIEGHLSKYIETGDIDISTFVSADKVETIKKALQGNLGAQLSAVKEALGSNYSYGEIRMTISHLKVKEKG